MSEPSDRQRAQDELQRLLSGVEPLQKPKGLGVVRFTVRCPYNASDVIDRSKEVLIAVLQNALEKWPTDEEWRRLLPEWFVSKCAREQTKEEAKQWLKWWDTLSMDERYRVSKDKKWSVLNWLYWRRPDNRQWYWWDAVVKSDEDAVVEIEVDGWPFPWGDLSWLLRASGATSVDSV